MRSQWQTHITNLIFVVFSSSAKDGHGQDCVGRSGLHWVTVGTTFKTRTQQIVASRADSLR